MKTKVEIEAYSVAQRWRRVIVQNFAHVINFQVTRRTEQVPRKVSLQRAENPWRDIEFQVIVLFRFVILLRIQHQSRPFLSLARVSSLNAVFSS